MPLRNTGRGYGKSNWGFPWPVWVWGLKSNSHGYDSPENRRPGQISGYAIGPVLRHLHWLPVHRRVLFKFACLVHQAMSGQATK